MPVRVDMNFPKRFSLQTMLVAVAVVALAIIIWRDRVRLGVARDLYFGSHARWMALRIRLEDLVTASEKLAQDEAESSWITRRAAEGQHSERMKKLIEKFDHGTWENMPSEIERRRNFVINNIRKYEPDYQPPAKED
jgi:hypothetical protein